MREIRQFTLGELIELAVEKELVEFCYVSSKVVVISIGRHQLSFALEEARQFLQSLVQGWSRLRAPAAAGSSSGRPAPGLFPPLTLEPGGDAGLGDPPLETATGPWDETAPSEDYLEAVLSLAQELRLIKGYDKDFAKGRVRLHTNGATAELSCIETLEYLTGSILHELSVIPEGVER